MSLSSVSGYGLFSASYTQTIGELRRNLDALNVQLATGKKADSYAGLGNAAGMSLAVRGRLNTLAGYSQTISLVQLRLDTLQTSLTNIGNAAAVVRGSLDPTATRLVDGDKTTAQKGALLQLDAMIEMLNAQIAGRHLFGGRDVEDRPVAGSAEMLEGAGGRAGFNAVVAERVAADFGTGTGRLAITRPTPASVRVAPDAAADHPFGFKIAAGGMGTTIAGASVSVDAGTPRGATIELAQQPVAGDTVRLTLELPDGTTSEISLTAVTGDPGVGEFRIGATADDTAAALAGAVQGAIEWQARTSLAAASTMAAANDFFTASPPQRVDIPPGGIAQATSLRDGTADTVAWYRGDDGADSARGTQAARIDGAISVGYGARASEPELRDALAAVAALSAAPMADAGSALAERYGALLSRVWPGLQGPSGGSPVEGISVEIAHAQFSVKAAAERHTASKAVLDNMLDAAEGADTQETAVQILTLQTRLQASYQTTALLAQFSLVNYL